MEQKKCITCGKVFVKGSNISRKSWLSVKYCSRSCINQGRISRFRGQRHLTDEQKLHLHKVLIGRRCNTGRTHIQKGQHLSPDTELKKGNIPWSTGKKLLYQTGDKNNNWKGGVTPEHSKIRHSSEMKNLRDEIFKRDNYTCRTCGRKRRVGDRVILNIHHIKPFAIHKELRFDKDNVITLCKECHIKTDTYGRNI